MTDESAAALYAALAKAQGEFPPIPRDKEVTVKTRDGRAYSFAYAPLDAIIEKVRPALAKHELAVTQTFLGDSLVTALLHAAGGRLESSLPIQRAGGSWQEFGSAVTYARRYALVSLLGVASEEDDDGNHASGHTAAAPRRKEKPLPPPSPPPPPVIDADDGPDREQLTIDLLNMAITLGVHDETAALAKSHRERNSDQAHVEWLKRQIGKAESKLLELQEHQA